MATIVTLDQSVPALTADLGVSSPAENLALKNAMTTAGIITGSGPAPVPLPNGNIVITTATLPTPGAFAMGSTIRLASFVMPRAGKVCIVGTCSFAAPGFSGTFIGGSFTNILKTLTPFTSNAALNPPPNNSIIASSSTYNSLGITGVLSSTVSAGNCTVAAGDVITFSGQVLNISSGTGNWMIADSVYSATVSTTGGNTFSYFYIE